MAPKAMPQTTRPSGRYAPGARRAKRCADMEGQRKAGFRYGWEAARDVVLGALWTNGAPPDHILAMSQAPD